MTNTSKTKLFASTAESAKFAATCRKKKIYSKKSLREELKNSGKFATEKNVSIVLDEMDRQEKALKKRDDLNQKHYQHRKVRPFFISSKNWPSRVLKLEPGATARRLDISRKDSVQELFERKYRVCVNGSVSVDLTDDPSKINVRQYEYRDFDVYRGKYKGWACRVQNTTITVPRRWRTRVQRKGLAVVDGMMTLDASRMQADGCELFSASWIKQGRGNNVELVSGYIARSGAYSYHASTPDQAIKGIKRKINAMSLEIALDNGDDLSRLSSGFESAIVRISDAQAIGACDFGIKNWCARAGLDYAAGSASLRDVVAAYRAHPLIEARATILRVLRRLRADRQPMAA